MTNTITSVKNIRWANSEHTAVSADIKADGHDDLLNGYPDGFPFSCTELADGPLAEELWQRISAGEFPDIAEYIPPTPEEIRASMPNLTARQIRLGLLSLGKLSDVPAAISALPEPARTEATIEWDYASEFRRLNSLIVQLIPILGLTDEQIDPVWMEYSTV